FPQSGHSVHIWEAAPAPPPRAGAPSPASPAGSWGPPRRFPTAGEALAKPAGQTLARWLVLEAVQDAPATVAQVARTLHLARQGVQRLADLLVRDGLAVYQDNPAHRRAKLPQLTPRGRATLRTILTAQATWANALGAQCGGEGVGKASFRLGRVMEAVTAASPG